jgi:hypothetical protein
MRLHNLDLNKLHVFGAVVEQGGVGSAAAHLGRTPSAVSQSVSALEGGLGVKLFDRVGKRLVLTWSKERAERDARTRELILENIGKKLGKEPTPRQLVTHRGYRQFVKGMEEGAPELDWDAVEAAKRRDGFYGVITNIPREKMQAEEVYGRYKDLWRIEDAFGEIKGTFQTRPMFHWKDRRIEGHVLLCLLAYYAEAVITKALREKKAEFTAPTWFRALNEIYAVPVTVRGTRAWVRTELNDVATKGYRFLNLKPPDRVLKIEKVDVVAQNSEALVNSAAN